MPSETDKNTASIDTETETPSVLAVTAHRPEEVIASLSGMDAETRVLSIDASVGPLRRVVTTTRRTRQAINEIQPDILLLDAYETIGAPATIVARHHDVPIVARLVADIWRKVEDEQLAVAREEGDLVGYSAHRVSHALNSFVLKRAAGFVAVSSALQTVIQRRTGHPPENIGVVPVPVTTDTGESGSASQARTRFGLGEKRVLLTVTNLDFRAKLDGVRRIVSEIAPLLRADEELAYLVAGGGRYHGAFLASLDDELREPSIRRRVYAPGHVEGVSDLYALADVFVYVSYLDGYPNAVLEAQTAGLPVVANAIHGMCDQITDGDTGFLVEDEPGQLRDRVASLLDDEEKRRRMGARGRERVRRENLPEAVSERLEAFLTGFLARRR
jgi:glycosyltransferase involved in cell wall biosynthesis